METQHAGNGNGAADIAYRPYKEWMNLTSEQRKEILKARGEAQAKGIKNWNVKKTDENNNIRKRKKKG